MSKQPYSDSRWWDNPESRDILCNSCKNKFPYREGEPASYGKCTAFPNGIPKEHINRGEDENFRAIELTKETAKNCNNGIGYEPE